MFAGNGSAAKSGKILANLVSRAGLFSSSLHVPGSEKRRDPGNEVEPLPAFAPKPATHVNKILTSEFFT